MHYRVQASISEFINRVSILLGGPVPSNSAVPRWTHVTVQLYCIAAECHIWGVFTTITQ